MKNNLNEIGFSFFHESYCLEHEICLNNVARVIADSRERYIIQTIDGNCFASLTGNLRFNAVCRLDLPAVGDWVQYSMADNESAIIQAVLPRKTKLVRSAVGKKDEQLIAANIDTAFIVMAADRDFNLNRLDRYLAIVLDSGIMPAVILNKTDLLSQEKLANLEMALFKRQPGVEFIATSLVSKEGLEKLESAIKPAQTFCLLGSSGVGKSSLVNYLAQQKLMETSQVSDYSSRGRHTTSSRNLHRLKNGALLLDTPGMREIAMADVAQGVAETFSRLEELARTCRFKDCRHNDEPGCAIRHAIAAGQLEQAELTSFHKLQREARHFKENVVEKRRRFKEQGRLYKNIAKFKKTLKG